MALFEVLDAAVTRVGMVSLQAVAVVVLIVAVQRVFRRALTPAWRYALWGILLVRLLLLWAPPAPWSLFNMAKAVPAPVTQQLASIRPPEPQRPLALMRDVGLGGAAPSQADETWPALAWTSPEAANPSAPMTIEPRVTPTATLPYEVVSFRILLAVWLLGAACTLGLLLLQWRRARRLIHAATPIRDDSALTLLAACCEEAGIQAYPFLYESADVASPMIAGLGRPALLVPAGFIHQTTRQQLRLVLLHELTHLRRRDLWWDLAIYGLLVIHWFNPVLWWAVYRIVDDRELACDAAVLERLTPTDRHAYGHTLLDVLQRYREPSWSPGFATIAEKRSLLERRIAMITRFHTMPRWAVAAGTTALAVLAAVSLTNPTIDGQAAADLSISHTDIWASTADNGLQLHARVTNHGQEPAVATVRFTEDSSGAETRLGETELSIPAGGEAYAKIDWQGRYGAHPITVEVFPSDDSADTDKRNNVATRTIAYSHGRIVHEDMLTDDLSQYETYVPDPEVLGKWTSVDFVDTPEDYVPGQKRFRGSLYLEGLVFSEENGYGTVDMMKGATFPFTKGLIIHPGDQTASRYEIREVDGQETMFFEWKSGDVTIRHRAPKYYVLTREKDLTETEAYQQRKAQRIDELVSEGVRHLGVQEFDSARQYFEQALLIDPDNLRAQEGLREAAQGQATERRIEPPRAEHEPFTIEADESPRTAAAASDSAAAFDTHSGYPVLSQAETLYQEGKLDEAIPLYRQVYQDYPDWNYAETALMMIGIIKAKQGKHKESVQWLERAVDSYGNIPGWSETTWYYLGEAYMQTKQYDRAEEAFQHTVSMLDRSRQTGHFAYRGSKQRLRELVGPDSEASIPSEDFEPLPAINARIDEIMIGSDREEDLVKILGKPIRRHGQCVNFPGEVSIYMPRGVADEIRFESPGSGYKFRGRIGVGSALEDVVAELGPPSATVVGRNDFEDGVLYRDIDGTKGYCYYARADQRIRMFFTNYVVKALYLTQ